MRQVIARASCGTLKAYLNNKVVVVVGKRERGLSIISRFVTRYTHTHLHYTHAPLRLLEADSCLIGSIL